MFQSKKIDTAGAVQSSAGGAETAGTGGGGGAERRATKSSHLLMLSASFGPDLMTPMAMPPWFFASTAMGPRSACAARKLARSEESRGGIGGGVTVSSRVHGETAKSKK